MARSGEPLQEQPHTHTHTHNYYYVPNKFDYLMCKIVNCGYTQTQHRIHAPIQCECVWEKGVSAALKLEFNACIMLLFSARSFVRSFHSFVRSLYPLFRLLETSANTQTRNGTSTTPYIHSIAFAIGPTATYNISRLARERTQYPKRDGTERNINIISSQTLPLYAIAQQYPSN